MNTAYQTFLDLKIVEKESIKASRADATLDCYRKIREMLDAGFDDSFLESVESFIESKEYSTDKQNDIVDRIYRYQYQDFLIDRQGLPF